ncbi:hypothetical protein WISP_69169 [Willisornis vidua]|uniref:Endonuclease/exonuclease/phosphatase domain-containing protein n=1 Tax=Willisornis vidua TaxID=1566151 RepID=A0ABQ9DDL6_9PASS|nr:hypothetical protein WISP_69169 [Willisornis vidua]
MGENQAGNVDILVGVCYRPLSQDEEVDGIFYKQLVDVFRSPALVLSGDFNVSDVCWELNTVEKRHSRRLLEYMENSFLSRLLREATRGGAALDLLFRNREGLLRDVVVRGHLGQSDHEIIEFSILSETRRGNNKTSALDFQRADFDLFSMLTGRVP